MIRLIFLLILIIPVLSYSQSVLPLRADTVRIEKINGSAELHLRNATRDSLGVLTNIGNGRTRFLKSRRFGDTLFIGKDTILNARKVDTLYKDGDSIRFTINGSAYAFLGGGGSFTLYNALGGSGDTLVNADQEIKWLNVGFGLARSATGTTVTHRADTARGTGLPTYHYTDSVVAAAGGGGSGISEIEADYGLIKVNDSTLKADTANQKLATRYAVYNQNQYNLNAQPFALQPMAPGTLGFAADASCVRLNNGKILAIYARTGTANDFNNYVLYSGTIDSLNKIEPLGALFPGGYIPENSQINPSVFRLPSGNIGLIFQGYNSGTDVQLYFTQSSDEGVTWAAETQILTDSDVGHLFLVYPDRVVKDNAGNYWLPIAVNTDDDPSTQTGDWAGRFLKSTNGTTWTLASTQITATTNDVIEPGMYESDVDVSDAAGDGTKKMVFYWRSRQNTAMYKDSAYGAGSYSTAATAMGLDMPNAPVSIKYYKKKLFASYNQLLTNASTGQMQRNKLVYAISNTGENKFNIVATVYQDQNTDTITPFEPTLYIDTTNGSVLVFYSTLWTVTNYGDLLVNRFNNVFTNMGVQEYLPGFATLDIYGGNNTPHMSPLYLFSVFDKTRGWADSHFSIGNGISDHSAFAPSITTMASSSLNLGSIWDARIGSDTYASPYSAGVVINGLNHAGSGALSNADVLAVLNNSAAKLRVTASGLTRGIEPADNDSTDAFVTSAWTKRNGGAGSSGPWTTNGSGNIYFPSNSTTKFVGIGTATPAYPIDVRVATTGTNGYSFLVADSNSSLGATFVYGWPLASSGADRYKAFFVDGNGWNIGTLPNSLTGAPTAQLTGRNGGNIGIGTATPSFKLTVIGTVGFDLGSDATGDIFYRNSGGAFTRLGVGSNGDVLTLASGLPSWAAPSGATTIYTGDGSLSGARTITGAGNTLTLTGTQSSNSAFNVNNTGNGGAGAFSTTGTGSALTGSNSSSGNGVLASSSSGNGLSATSTTGLAIRGKITPSSTTTIVHPFRTIRGTSGTAAAGLGGGWDMQLTDDAGNDVTAGVITPVWTSAATGATTGDIQMFTTNAGSSTLKLTLKGNGQLRLHGGYGAGTFTGTATEGAAFDANGNIIVAPLVAAAAYTPTITSGTNVASTTLQGADYQRIGDYVIVHLILLIDPTTTGATDIGISFPFASAISAGETKGTGNCRLVSGQNGTIIGDLANARAKFEYNATVATEEQFMIEFSYKITPP